MKYIIFCLLFIGLGQFATAQKTITADKGIKVQSFIDLLPDAEKRIINLTIDTSIADGKTFYIKANAKNATIKALTQNGLMRGFMYLLNRSGIEYGGYSDRWIEIDYKPYMDSGSFVSSYATNLGYFGTGGLGTDATQKKLSERHHNALGLIGPYGSITHAFHYFYSQNKAAIDADTTLLTDYWAIDKTGKKVPGKRVDPNLDNGATLPLIRNWVYASIDKNPQIPHVSLGTADGLWSSNIKLPRTIPAIKNTIDKYMWIVNEVARSVKKDRPEWKGVISYNAYGNGTGVVIPPAFKLEDNILVQLFTAFQRDYKTDLELFNAWHTAHPNIQKQYGDYWNITQWSLGGLPNDNVIAKAKRILPILKENNIENFKIESTHFSIVMNPHWWVMSKYMLGYEQKTIDEWYDLYYQTFFKEVATDVKGLYEYWNNNWAGEATLPFIIQKTNTILNKAQTPAVKDRVIEIISYVHYLKKYYDTKNEFTVEAAEDLENYAAKVNDLGTLQSWAVYRYNYGSVKPYGFGDSKNSWAHYKTNTMSWPDAKSYLLNEFAEDVANFPIRYEIVPFKKDLISVRSGKAKSRSFKTYMGTALSFRFNVDKARELTFKWTPEKAGDKLHLTDDDLLYETIVASADMAGREQKYEKRLQPERVYTIKFTPARNSNISNIDLPADIAFIYDGGRLASSNGPNNWFMYVPKKVTHIIFQPGMDYNLKKGTYVALQKPDNSFAKPESTIAKHTYKIKVEPKDRGKTWRVYTRSDKWKILNFDPILSTIDFEYDK